MTNNRQMPHHIESEMALLGGMMLDSRVILDVRRIVDADSFYEPRHGVIFSAMAKLSDAGTAFDAVMLHSSMSDAGTLQGVGGIEYVIELANSVPSASSSMHYAKIVKLKADARTLIDTYSGAAESILAGNGDLSDVVAKVESGIDSLRDGHRDGEAVRIGDVARQVYDVVTDPDNNGGAIPTGFYELDEMLGGGFRAGDYIVVAARPSMGKTAICMDMSECVAGQTEFSSLVFSAEMSKEAVVKRMFAKYSGVSSSAIRSGRMDDGDRADLAHAVGKIDALKLWIDDTPSPTVPYISSACRMHARKHGKPALIVVDYMQLLTPGGQHSREQQVSEMSRNLKTIARRMSVPVMVLAQLNRECEKEKRKPRKSDLRDSGGIEQDADVVMFIHREDQYHIGEDGYNKDNMGELILDKQRNGPTGKIKLVWDGNKTTFKNLMR